MPKNQGDTPLLAITTSSVDSSDKATADALKLSFFHKFCQKAYTSMEREDFDHAYEQFCNALNNYTNLVSSEDINNVGSNIINIADKYSASKDYLKATAACSRIIEGSELQQGKFKAEIVAIAYAIRCIINYRLCWSEIDSERYNRFQQSNADFKRFLAYITGTSSSLSIYWLKTITNTVFISTTSLIIQDNIKNSYDSYIYFQDILASIQTMYKQSNSNKESSFEIKFPNIYSSFLKDTIFTIDDDAEFRIITKESMALVALISEGYIFSDITILVSEVFESYYLKYIFKYNNPTDKFIFFTKKEEVVSKLGNQACADKDFIMSKFPKYKEIIRNNFITKQILYMGDQQYTEHSFQYLKYKIERRDDLITNGKITESIEEMHLILSILDKYETNDLSSKNIISNIISPNDFINKVVDPILFSEKRKKYLTLNNRDKIKIKSKCDQIFSLMSEGFLFISSDELLPAFKKALYLYFYDQLLSSCDSLRFSNPQAAIDNYKIILEETDERDKAIILNKIKQTEKMMNNKIKKHEATAPSVDQDESKKKKKKNHQKIKITTQIVLPVEETFPQVEISNTRNEQERMAKRKASRIEAKKKRDERRALRREKQTQIIQLPAILSPQAAEAITNDEFLRLAPLSVFPETTNTNLNKSDMDDADLEVQQIIFNSINLLSVAEITLPDYIKYAMSQLIDSSDRDPGAVRTYIYGGWPRDLLMKPMGLVRKKFYLDVDLITGASEDTIFNAFSHQSIAKIPISPDSSIYHVTFEDDKKLSIKIDSILTNVAQYPDATKAITAFVQTLDFTINGHICDRDGLIYDVLGLGADPFFDPCLKTIRNMGYALLNDPTLIMRMIYYTNELPYLKNGLSCNRYIDPKQALFTIRHHFPELIKYTNNYSTVKNNYFDNAVKINSWCFKLLCNAGGFDNFDLMEKTGVIEALFPELSAAFIMNRSVESWLRNKLSEYNQNGYDSKYSLRYIYALFIQCIAIANDHVEDRKQIVQHNVLFNKCFERAEDISQIFSWAENQWSHHMYPSNNPFGPYHQQINQAIVYSQPLHPLQEGYNQVPYILIPATPANSPMFASVPGIANPSQVIYQPLNDDSKMKAVESPLSHPKFYQVSPNERANRNLLFSHDASSPQHSEEKNHVFNKNRDFVK